MALTVCNLLMVVCISTTCIHLVTSAIKSENLTYTIDEEGPSDLRVGNLIHDTSLKDSGYNAPGLLFNYLSTPPIHFRVDASTGDLRTVGRIDRDEFCPNADRCTKNFTVGVMHQSRIIEMIKVTVTIRDINDNAPYFETTKTVIHISELSPPGSKFLLPPPFDPDSPQLSLKRYDNFGAKFWLKSNVRANDRIELFLETKVMLDRELESSYNFQIIAYDGGAPPRTGSLNVTIVVDDVNDNDPVFDQQTYRTSLLENSAAHTTIVQVHASDLDSGVNKVIIYALTEHGDMFGINNGTGEIYVKGIVDYEVAHTYYLSVTATDQGTIQRSTETTVIVDVHDVNDHSPEITITPLGAPATGIAEISENSEIGTYVAHVIVDDMDSGSYGACNCTLSDNKFRLEQLFDTNYQIVTSGELDREKISEYSLAIRCVDKAVIPLESVKNLLVRLTDVNDNTPQFQQAIYRANVVENNNVGEFILQLNATDADSGENAEVTYMISEGYQKMFVIDERSGRVTAKLVFDREQVSQMQFDVIVRDRGISPLSSSAQIVVTIQDINDEMPVFTQTMYSFNVSENEPQNTEVGTVSANDADQFPFNEFLFSIVPDTNLLDLFVINARSGKITTKGVLNREVQSVFKLVVLASDYGSPIKSSTADIVIYITDQNDNTPVFNFPEKHNNTVQMSSRTPIGVIVACINASDLDAGDNGRLTYKFSKGNSHAFFNIDQNTGDVSVNVEFKDVTYELYEFKVTAQDHGFPQKLAEATLNIFVNKSIPYPLAAHSGSALSRQNFSIAIALAAVSAIVIFVLIVAIVLIRRQERVKMQQYNCRMEALRKLTVKAGSDGKSEKESRPLESAKRKSKKVPYEIDFTDEKEDEKKRIQSDPKSNYCNWPGSYELDYSAGQSHFTKPNTACWFSRQNDFEVDKSKEVTMERDKDSTGSGDSGRGASEEGEGRGKQRVGEKPLSPNNCSNQPPPLKKRSNKHPYGTAPKRHSKLNKAALVSPPSQTVMPANYLLPPANSSYMPLVHATPTRVLTPGYTSIKSDNPRNGSGEGPQISKQVLV